MQDWSAFITALAQAGWVAIVGYFLFQFRAPLVNVLGRLSKFSLRLPDGTEVEATAYEVAGIAQQLLDEVDQSLLHDIKQDEQRLMSYIIGCDWLCLRADRWRNCQEGLRQGIRPRIV